MTDSPLSRRQFFGATAAATALAVGTASAAPERKSTLAPEPPPPPGVCQRLGSARFRELEGGYRFSPDSKWLANFHGRFLAYEVVTGRRVAWRIPDGPDLANDWQMTTAGEVVAMLTDGGVSVHRFHLESGRELKTPTISSSTHFSVTPDGTGLIQHVDVTGQLWRTDLHAGKTVWKRKWECDASVPAVAFEVTERWVVGVGVKRLHLFDPRTGKDGPRLEDAEPKDAPPDNHFIPFGCSADGKRIAGWFTADAPERLVVWELQTGKVVGRFTLPEGAESGVLTADGRHVLTTDGRDRLVGVEVRTGKVARKLAAENVDAFQLSPDGKVLACLQSVLARGLGGIDGLNNEPGGIIRLLDPNTGELLPQTPDPSVELTAVRFVNPHSVVATLLPATSDTSALVWDNRTNRRRAVIDPNSFNFGAGLPYLGPCLGFGERQAELSPDGSRWVAEFQSRVVVADAFTGRALHAFAGDQPFAGEPLFWVGRGKVGRFTEAGLLVWDLAERTRRVIPLKFPAEGEFEHTAATPDGQTVVAVHWNPEEQQPKRTLAWVNVATGEVKIAAAGSAGRVAVSAHGDRVALTTVEDPPGEPSRVRVAVLDRDGRSYSFHTTSAFNWDVYATAELSACGRTAFFAHTKLENETDPRPVVQFWEVVSGELRAEYATAYTATGLGVSPCGRRVVTSHRDAPIYLWDVFGETSAPQPKPDAKTWDALAGDADTAFTAVRQLVQHPAAAVELLSAKLSPAEQPKAEWVKARIDRLGSRDFRTRHTAEQELAAVADRLREPLRKALDAGADSPEAEERLTRLLDLAEGMPRPAWRIVRAVEALEYCDVPAAGALLKKLAGGVESAVLTTEAKAAVRRASRTA